MTAPKLLTPNQIIIKSGTYIVIESIAGATLTCGSQSYTLGSGETVHAFEVTAGTYTCTANKADYYEASDSVTISTGFEYVTIKPLYLPAAYQQVEYLRATGTQYIVTPVTPADNQIIAFRYMLTEFSNTTRVFATSDGTTQLTITPNDYYAFNNSPSTGAYSNINLRSTGIIYDCIYNASTTFTVNGVDYSNSLKYGGATSDKNIWLFSRYNTSGQNLKGNIYYFRITQSGSKIIDLVPCYRKSDSVAGMYDKATDTFLTNSGTGSFAVGADVQ